MSLFIYVYFRFCLKVTSCEYLSLSFRLTSVSVVISRSSVLLPMALFHSSLWLSGTPSWMCTALLYAVTSRWPSGQFPYTGCCEICCFEHGRAVVRVCPVAQSCPALCDPTGCSQPGSSVRGILQARTLEWAALPSSRGSQ